MNIRKATVGDCRKLTELRMAMRKERESKTIEDWESFRQDTYRYFYENIEEGGFVSFIAEENGEVIATSGICFYRVPPTFENRNGLVAYIMNMYTVPAYRRRGIAGRLLECIVNEAKTRGCIHLTLNASQMGKPVYLKYGFQEVQNDMVYDIR